MSLPKITEVIGGFDYSWETEKVKVECRRLSLHSQELKGEIIISCTASGVKANHLHQASFNFSSSQSRERLASLLAKKWELDWSVILEQACVYTLDRFRRGESVVEIDSSRTDITPPEYLLKPFLIKNYPTIFFGDPSAGKSLISMAVATAVSLPWYGNPLGWDVPETPLKVLYLDWETDRATVEWTLSRITQGMNTGPVFLHYRRCNLPLAYDVEQISQWIADCGADLTIIDSLGLAAGGDLNATEPALAFWTAWRRLKTTSLILGHVRKNEADNSAARSVYGNMYYTAEARCIWEVKKNQDQESPELNLCLHNRKPPPFAKLHRPMGIQVNFDGGNGVCDRIMMKWHDPETVGEFLQQMPGQTQLLNLLRHGPYSNKEIVDETGLTSDNVRKITQRLREKDKIVRTPDGEKWALAYHG